MKMIPKNTNKIILFLLKEFDFYNINQISRKLKVSVGSVFKILRKLEEDRIILVRQLGNAKYYQLNLDNRETVGLCELLLLKEKRFLIGYARIYAEEIKKCEDASLIILFGSVLEGKKFNDVDVLFVSDKVKDITKFCLNVSKVRAKPIVPLIITKKDLVKEIKNKKEVVLDLIKKGVVIKGELMFLEVIRNAKSKI